MAEARNDVETIQDTVSKLQAELPAKFLGLYQRLKEQIDALTSERDVARAEQASAQDSLAQLRLDHRALKEDAEADRRRLEQATEEALELRGKLEALTLAPGSVETITLDVALRDVDRTIADRAKDGWTARPLGVVRATVDHDPNSARIALVCTRVLKRG
jgi:DNA repair exonuclease SbcCD ATPase subunit